MSVFVHAHLKPNDRIACETGDGQHGASYPVLVLGEITLFPESVHQCRQIRDAITRWLLGQANYMPTVVEAIKHPDAFVAGMTEDLPVVHHGIPDFSGKPLPRE